jgi:hypothetical protein
MNWKRWLRAAALTMLLTAPMTGNIAPMVAPARASATLEYDAPGLTPAKKSKIVPILLPEGAFRYENEPQTAQFVKSLKQQLKESKARIGAAEVLLWQGLGAKKKLPALLKSAGLRYEARTATETETGKVTPFTAAHEGKKSGAIGMWLEQNGNTMLVWATVSQAGTPHNAGADAEEEQEKQDDTEANAEKPGAATHSRIAAVKLPEGAVRGTGKAQSEAAARNLNQVAKKSGVKADISAESVEILVWQKGGAAVRKALHTTLDKAGYTRTDHEPIKIENGQFLLFTATGKKAKLFGMWVESGQAVMLVWGKVGPKAPSAEEIEEADAEAETPEPTRKPAPRKDREDEEENDPISAQPIDQNGIRFASANPQSSFSTDGQSLPEEAVESWEDSLNYILGVRMSAAERGKMRNILTTEWNRGNAETREKILSMGRMMEQINQLSERKRALTRRAQVLSLMLAQDKVSRQGDLFAQFQIDLYRAAHPPVSAATPFVSAEIADAFIDAYLFVGAVRSGKPAPKMSKAAREKARQGVAADFARLPEKQRKTFIDQMVKATTFLMQWPDLQEHERLLARAELGAKLSPEEQSLAAQVQQMMRSHTLRMAVSALNNMQQNQQIIMGSAPFWNPSTNRWEKIGGINTEYR